MLTRSRHLACVVVVVLVGCGAVIQPPPDESDSVCTARPLDGDADGVADGIDTDCDGWIDTPIPTGGMPNNDGGGIPDGSGNGGLYACHASLSTNESDRQITCTNAGGPLSCECWLDGLLVLACTPSASQGCERGTNCCGFD